MPHIPQEEGNSGHAGEMELNCPSEDGLGLWEKTAPGSCNSIWNSLGSPEACVEVGKLGVASCG